MTKCPTGKVRYETQYEAKQAQIRIRQRVKRSKSKRRAWERNPYLCVSCHGWHLTSTVPA